MKIYYAFDRGIFMPQFCRNLSVHVNPVTKDLGESPFFTEGFFENPSLPWEVRYDNAYPNVIYDEKEKLYRLYYTLIIKDPVSEQTDKQTRATTDYVPTAGRVVAVAYAQSRDGVHWVKPSLGLVEWSGSTNNNILMVYAHGTGVMLDDTDTDPARRYKMMTLWDVPGEKTCMSVSFSADGIHWEQPIPCPELRARGDSHNFVFKDSADGKYKVITRLWRNNLRISAISESEDFLYWSEPKEILRGRGFEAQVYSMPVFCCNGLYLGLASLLHEGDADLDDFDTVDCELTYATKPDVFDFAAPGEAFIPRGEGRYPSGEFDCGCVFSAAPIEIDGKLCFYYMGGNGRHTNFRETSFGRAFLEKDKFAYACARDNDREAVWMTSPIRFSGDELRLLWEGDGEPSLRACLMKNPRRAERIPGFEEEDARLIPLEGGWYKVEFSQSFSSLDGLERYYLVLSFAGGRIYALKGDFSVASPNY